MSDKKSTTYNRNAELRWYDPKILFSSLLLFSLDDLAICLDVVLLFEGSVISGTYYLIRRVSITHNVMHAHLPTFMGRLNITYTKGYDIQLIET